MAASSSKDFFPVAAWPREPARERKVGSELPQASGIHRPETGTPRRNPPGDMHDQVNRSAPADIGFVVEPPAARDDDVMPLGLRAERHAFGLGLKAIMLQHIAKRNVADLVGEFRDFHLLIGHPNERRSSLNVLVTSSGEGQSDNAFVIAKFLLPRGLRLRRWIVRRETKSRLVGGEFAMKLVGSS